MNDPSVAASINAPLTKAEIEEIVKRECQISMGLLAAVGDGSLSETAMTSSGLWGRQVHQVSGLPFDCRAICVTPLAEPFGRRAQIPLQIDLLMPPLRRGTVSL